MHINVGKIIQIMPNSRLDNSVDLEFEDGSIFVGYRGKIIDDDGKEISASVKDYVDSKQHEANAKILVQEEKIKSLMLALAEVAESMIPNCG